MLKTTDFIQEIEALAKEKKITCLEALMYYVEKYKVEPEAVASLVRKSGPFKAKLKEECVAIHLVEE